MSWAIWITGLPGSGKSALARRAAERLREQGEPVHVLELDEIRTVLTPSPVYTEAERDVVYHALVFMAAALAEHGVPVIIDATAHRRAWRELARARIRYFAEVQLSCPLEVCRAREARRRGGHAPRGIYARAGRPGAAVPGVDVPYEPAGFPELVVRTDVEDPGTAAGRVVTLARSLGSAAPPRRAPGGAAWAVWITGRPGSGKTTVARAVLECLAARGLSVRGLSAPEVRQAILADSLGPAAGREMIHRVLACAAKVLTDAGVPVIVDAGAPRRAWRDLARGLIPRFAEVQLVCPGEICTERERAARWDLRFTRPVHAERPPEPRGVEIVSDYEESLRPELRLQTHVQGLWTTVEEVLLLIRRRLMGPPSIFHVGRTTPCE
ncbi:MAG: adenylyl-sulfate kinase [Candidatus Rokubacteria bacterium]|nr:adenylyl-sulfate kinase [Candidatus Rokubacteria bacterium]